MKAFLIAGVLALAAVAPVAQAQDFTADHYPRARVRMFKGDKHFPDPYYVTNRVVLRTVRLAAAGGGMQLSGDLLTDFDADRIPAGETQITRGQQRVNVEIELVHYATQLKRRNNVVVDPKINPTKPDNPGVQVPGQVTTVAVAGRMDDFGHATFQMPAMERPLAPGIYVLVARVTFASQAASVQKSIKWCSDWFGSDYVGTDPDTGEPLFKSVMADKDLHDRYYDEVMYTVRKAESYCMIYIGETLVQGAVNLTAPGDRRAANYVLWTPHHEMAAQVQQWAFQIDNADKIIQEDLDKKLALDGITEEMKERFKREAELEKIRIKRDNQILLDTWGGRCSPAENAMVTTALAAQPALLQQMMVFEEFLSHRYWVLCDGFLYAGYHTVNAPGANAWQAVSENDLRKYGDERRQKMDEMRRDKAAYDAKWQKRQTDWRFYPAEVKAVVFDYLRTKEEKDNFDPEKFCVQNREAKTIELDIEKWNEYRTKFIESFFEKTDKIFDDIITTRRYINQVWPDALNKVMAARDAVISVAYSWEYHTRTQKMGHTADQVVKEWREAATRENRWKLDRFFNRAQGAPGTVKITFDTLIREVKGATNITEFAVVYRRAIEANTAEKDLPGSKKPN